MMLRVTLTLLAVLCSPVRANGGVGHLPTLQTCDNEVTCPAPENDDCNHQSCCDALHLNSIDELDHTIIDLTLPKLPACGRCVTYTQTVSLFDACTGDSRCGGLQPVRVLAQIPDSDCATCGTDKGDDDGFFGADFHKLKRAVEGALGVPDSTNCHCSRYRVSLSASLGENVEDSTYVSLYSVYVLSEECTQVEVEDDLVDLGYLNSERDARVDESSPITAVCGALIDAKDLKGANGFIMVFVFEGTKKTDPIKLTARICCESVDYDE